MTRSTAGARRGMTARSLRYRTRVAADRARSRAPNLPEGSRSCVGRGLRLVPSGPRERPGDRRADRVRHGPVAVVGPVDGGGELVRRGDRVPPDEPDAAIPPRPGDPLHGPPELGQAGAEDVAAALGLGAED